MSTTDVKQPPQKEEIRLTISPKIFKSLLASHAQNRHRVHKLGDVFESYDWTAGDDILYLNYIIASILGMEPDELNQTEEQFDFIEEQVIHFYDVYIIRKSKKPTSYELNYLQGFKKKDIDNLYNNLLKAQRKFGKMVDGDCIGEVIQENNQPVNETEQKPYTINEKIVKTLIAKHCKNARITGDITDALNIEEGNTNALHINWVIADMFGLENDHGYESKLDDIFNKFINTINADDPLKNPSRHEINYLDSYSVGEVDSIYNKLIDLQKEYKSERIKS